MPTSFVLVTRVVQKRGQEQSEIAAAQNEDKKLRRLGTMDAPSVPQGV